jgi:CBS domain-containing protein
MFGVTVELPLSNRRFDRELKKALASTVGELMHDEPVTIHPDATVRDAATVMHDRDVSRLPVVDRDGKLVGIVGRGDVLRYLVGGEGE